MNKWVRKSLLAFGLYDTVVDFRKWIAREEMKYIDFYRQFVSEGDLCFDVGANVGRRTRTFLKLKAKVVAVEPQPYCMKLLKRKYTGNSDVILLQKALGEKQGNAEMMICEAHSLSSLSTQWIESVKASGRYAKSNWRKTITVPVTTLDSLIAEYGSPTFIKIDVEGYEYDVIKGLSHPVKVICYELTPEFVDSALAAVAHLVGIGPAEFNYCLATQPTKLALPNWVSSEQMCHILESLQDMPTVADVYVRFK
jgi:FkbM family methyltransferase